ncbi:hypothetical protein BVIET440_240067 [Burkholderia vietnamiensis]
MRSYASRNTPPSASSTIIRAWLTELSTVLIRRATSLAERMGAETGVAGLRSIELIAFLGVWRNARRGRRGAGARAGAFAIGGI